MLREPAEEMMPPLPLPNRWLISQKEELGRNRATERIVFVLGELRGGEAFRNGNDDGVERTGIIDGVARSVRASSMFCDGYSSNLQGASTII